MENRFVKIIIYFLVILGFSFIGLAFWSNQKKATPIAETVAVLSDKSGAILSDNIEIASATTSTSTDKYRLAIPSIGVDMKIIFTDNEGYGLANGAWHLPGSGAPDDPDDYKNIIISAHRYLYTSGPNTFFNLDKVAPDDDIIITWAGQEYKYKIAKTFVVEPTEVSILADTGVEKLTLFTCTPVFTTKQRLVVEAYPYD